MRDSRDARSRSRVSSSPSRALRSTYRTRRSRSRVSGSWTLLTAQWGACADNRRLGQAVAWLVGTQRLFCLLFKDRSRYTADLLPRSECRPGSFLSGRPFFCETTWNPLGCFHRGSWCCRACCQRRRLRRVPSFWV